MKQFEKIRRTMAALIYLDKLYEDVHGFINFLQHKILLRLKYFYAEPNKF